MTDLQSQVLFASRRYAGAAVPAMDLTDLLVAGPPVDVRGREALNKLKSTAGDSIQLRFEPKGNRLLVNEEPVTHHRFVGLLQGKSVRMETTTLGLAEILFALRALDDIGIKRCEFIYIEPGGYAQTGESVRSEAEPTFALTQNCDFKGLQGFAHAYEDNDPAVHIYMLGYEQSRLLKAVEQRDSVDPTSYIRHVIVGIPPFEAGWENNVFSGHTAYLEHIGIRDPQIDYCPANSTQEAYLLLHKLYANYKSENRVFFVSPLGTKPHAVGAALFLLETRGATCPTSLYYDHPVRIQDRSREVAAWHHVKARWK